MNKTILKILCVIVGLILLYSIFITEESIRLTNGRGSKPFAIIGGTCDLDKLETGTSFKVECKGLGYTVKREYLLGGMSSEDNKVYRIIKEEFWLFDKFLLRGWVA